MGLAEILVTTLCLNATCDVDETVFTSFKQVRFAKLEDELKSETLTITTLQNGELSGFEIINGTIIGNGIAFDIINILQDKYKFNYTVVLPEDGTFLGSDDQKTVKTLIQTQQVDIAAAFLPILESIRKEITYSTSFDTAQWAVLMNRPTESAEGSGLLAPFTKDVWILIIFSILAVGPVIWLIVLIRAKLCREEHSETYSLATCLWFVYGALLKQGSVLNPVTDSARVLFSTWWLFILILTAFYTANLTAFLTLSKFTLPITTPEDIGQKHYHWVTNKANPLRDKILSENQDNYLFSEKLIEKVGDLRIFVNYSDMEILNNYVFKRNMMFIRERTVINHIMYRDYRNKANSGIEESKRCTYVVAKFPITQCSRAFAYNKDFKYKELFDASIQRLVEGGIIEFKLKENLPDAEICPLDLQSTERKLRNTDLLLTYILVSGGLSVALCVFFMEILWRLHLKKAHKKRSRLQPKWVGIEKSKPNLTPPPPYQALFKPPFHFNDEDGGKKTQINGRDYWIVKGRDGLKQMIPLRAPSALLFQFSN